MIPPIILPYVFQHLNDKELLNCSLVCKLWYSYTFDPLLSSQWKSINFQERVDSLTRKYIRDSAPVTNRLKKEEKMNWEKIYQIVLKRSKNHIQYLKMWSSFDSHQMHIMMRDHSLQHLIVLDLRGTNFDISNLFKMETKQEKVKLIKGKEKENDENDENDDNNDNDKENNKENKNINKKKKEKDNDNEKEKEKENTNIKEKGKQKDEKDENNSDNNTNEKTNNEIIKKPPTPTPTTTTFKKDTDEKKKKDISKESPSSILHSLHHLKYLYIYGCKNVSVDIVQKVQQQWHSIKLDVKICSECHELTRICPDRSLKSDPTIIEKISHCSVCNKVHCDHCRPLWTCEACGGDLTCQDCRAHGLKCTTCDCDYCYTCNQPRKILECRYCHRMSCGQSPICQKLGYRYTACNKCEYYVCMACKDDDDHLMTCSGEHCSKSFCKTCINETANNSLISFDKEEVEKRVRENNFALCSYCNKLYCITCIDNISFYVGSKELPYCIILCKECETFYKTQLINLFRMPQLNTSSYASSSSSTNERRQTTTSTHPTSYTDSLISMTQSNLLTSNTLSSMDSPIDIYNYDNYIR